MDGGGEEVCQGVLGSLYRWESIGEGAESDKPIEDTFQLPDVALHLSGQELYEPAVCGEAQRLGLGLKYGHVGDTTHLDAVDCQGTMVAATPSGGWIGSSPVIPGLGFPLGTRGQMFYLNPDRPNALAPHKRPRATLTPTLVTRDGEPYMVFGTRGGDAQDQWTLQFFLNVVDFGMNVQEASDAPTVYSLHFPSSFYPREAHPARVAVEGRVPREVVAELERRGHEILPDADWAHGNVMGIQFDTARGVMHGGASASGITGYALGW